jgi:pSer/pThr/pTyr-binding forkhead associated (FHA) protein
LNRARSFELVPGDVIGRSWNAALALSDPFASEAHAMVSLRDGALQLVGLRGPLHVGGRLVSEVVLSAGLTITLSPRTELEVIDLQLPETLLALEHPALGRRVLTGPVSLVIAPAVSLSHGARPDAAAVLWSDGVEWRARENDGTLHLLEPGLPLRIGGVEFPVLAVRVADLVNTPTASRAPSPVPLHLVMRYETVHIHREGAPTAVIDGLGARILSELAAAGVPVSWQTLASDLWSDETDVALLRRKWDSAMVRLRKKLREARIRADLVRTDRLGNFELFLALGDRVEDQT